MQHHPDVIVVGAGLAGLAAANAVTRGGGRVLVLEAGDRVGGRVATDDVDGFRLDRGFQVLLTAYPAARRILDLDALELGTFRPGALVWDGRRLVRVGDPLRDPAALVATLRSGIGTPRDRLRVLRLRRRVRRGRDPYELLAARSPGRERSTRDALRDVHGFSDEMVERFWRPFYAGIFLEPELASSERMFEFTMRMFSEGLASIPAGGIDAIARQLADRLPDDAVRLGTPVDAVDPRGVQLADGDRIEAGAVVLAAGPWANASLVPGGRELPGAASTSCLHYAAERPPISGADLVLAGDRGAAAGPAGVVCVPSNVTRGVSPDARALVCVNTSGRSSLDDAALDAAVRAQLAGWFGPAVHDWQHLRTLHVDHALPDQRPPWLDRRDWPLELEPGLYEAGDHVDTASIDGALRSGARAGELACAHAGMRA